MKSVRPVDEPLTEEKAAEAIGFEASDCASGERQLIRPRTGFRSAFVGILGLALPIGAYFWFIHRYAVNVVYWDQWSDLNLLSHWYAGSFSLSDLWAAHGDHRIFFPNLIVIALAQFTHFNVVFEEYLSSAMLVAATILIIVTHQRRSPSTPWLYYSPIAFLLFSFVQFQSTLWGFQIAWYLVTLTLALVLFLLDRPTLTRLAFVGAIAAAFIGSYSSLQGLLIWPVGLLLLYVRRRSSGLLIVWVVLGVVTAAAYFYHLDSNDHSNQTYVFSHPLEGLKFFSFLIGSVVGVQFTKNQWPVILFGVAIFAVAAWVLATYLRRDEMSSGPVGVTLACYGILFAAVVTVGRASFAVWAPSRYSTCGLMILAGCYLVLIDRPPRRSARRRAVDRKAVFAVLAAAICLQIILGTGHGLASAKAWSQNQKQVADITVNIGEASNTLVGTDLIKGHPAFSRQLVRVMKTHRLSLFATGADAFYSKVGLAPQLSDIQTRLRFPVDGATLKGTKVLDAEASDASGIVKVNFLIRSADRRLLVSATRTLYGWIAYWNTIAAPNGAYSLQSVVFGYGGKIRHSPIHRVTIANNP